MKSTKRYTNQTFTKRLDHEGGLHRTPRNISEPAVCEKCGAVYTGRRWTAGNGIIGENQSALRRAAEFVICPACSQIEAGVVGGYLSVSGNFLKIHRGEIEHLLNNEAKRAAEDNPLSRIIKWREEKDGTLTVETTTEHLAQRFGHALEKAFKGTATFNFSHENKLARVSWHRD